MYTSYSLPPSFGPVCTFLSPTSNATRNLDTQLYAAIVAVISTISFSLNCACFNLSNTASGTRTSRVMASVYASTADSLSPRISSGCRGSDFRTASTCALETSDADSRIGECDSHSYHALFSTATRHMAVSRMAGGRVVLVRIEPRNEFLL